MIISNGRGRGRGPCESPNVPDVRVVPRKDGKIWTVSSKFFNPSIPTPYYKSSCIEMVGYIFLILTLSFNETPSEDVMVVKASQIKFTERYRGEGEVHDLIFPSCFREIENWKNTSGVTLFHWWCAVRQKRVLIPNEADRNGGKSTWEINRKKEREEIKNILKYS